MIKRIKPIQLLMFVFMLIAACNGDENDDGPVTNEYKEKMREFVIGISTYARNLKNDFIVIPQNGQELATIDGTEEGAPALPYLNSISGVGREDLFYGYDQDDIATPVTDQQYMITFLDVCEKNLVEVLTSDYCFTHSKMDDSYNRNKAKGYISFAAPDRELSIIPDYPQTPFHENSKIITSLKEAENFLYLINTEKFTSKEDFIAAIRETNYDVIIMDLFYGEGIPFTASEIEQLKTKKNNGKRLVISYMSIGEAENYRYYWNSSWRVGNPVWLKEENPDWPGNFKVMYWEKEWQKIIYGDNNSYLKKIIDSGFDGVYLDIIDAFEYFE